MVKTPFAIKVSDCVTTNLFCLYDLNQQTFVIRSEVNKSKVPCIIYVVFLPVFIYFCHHDKSLANIQGFSIMVTMIVPEMVAMTVTVAVTLTVMLTVVDLVLHCAVNVIPAHFDERSMTPSRKRLYPKGHHRLVNDNLFVFTGKDVPRTKSELAMILQRATYAYVTQSLFQPVSPSQSQSITVKFTLRG